MKVALAALALGASGACLAAEEARWSLQVDNDVVFASDRWYTSGVRIARESGGIEVGVLQEIYTPEAKKWLPGVADRRPTARLLFSVAKHDVAPEVFQTLEVMAGVRGPSALGRQSAEAIHHVIPAPYVDWSRQLDDALDAGVAAVRSQALGATRLQAHYGAQVGTQVVFAHAGLEWRWGEGASRLLRFASTPDWAPASSPWSVFAGAGVRAVARNELLQGNYDVALAPVERRTGITRIAAGFAWRGRWGALTFEVAADSREFVEQRTPHAFGSLAFQASF